MHSLCNKRDPLSSSRYVKQTTFEKLPKYKAIKILNLKETVCGELFDLSLLNLVSRLHSGNVFDQKWCGLKDESRLIQYKLSYQD